MNWMWGHLPLLPLAVERKGSLHADTEHQDVLLAVVVFTEEAITRLRVIIRDSHVVDWESRIRRVPQCCCGDVYRHEVLSPVKGTRRKRNLPLRIRSPERNSFAQDDGCRKMEEIVVVERQAEVRRQEPGRTKKSRESPPNEGERENVGRNKDTHEELAEQTHKGEGPQEREDTDGVKNEASACRSLGRCPPVLGMVALRGGARTVCPVGFWSVLGSPPLDAPRAP